MIPFVEKRLNDLSPKKSDEKLPQAAVLILITDKHFDDNMIFPCKCLDSFIHD